MYTPNTSCPIGHLNFLTGPLGEAGSGLASVKLPASDQLSDWFAGVGPFRLMAPPELKVVAGSAF